MEKDIKNNLVRFIGELNQVCQNAGRDPKDVEILFAVKYLNPEEFVKFVDIAGEVIKTPLLVGENRVQWAEDKFNHIHKNRLEIWDKFKMVMIGSLQKNKINKALDVFTSIHSVDRVDLAKALNQRLTGKNKIMPVYLEVNISGESTKHGFKPEELEQTILTMKQWNNVTIKGFMTMAPHTENQEEIRLVFRKLRDLADHYNLKTSMGMSNDWKIAVKEGSDMVRVGSVIFR